MASFAGLVAVLLAVIVSGSSASVHGFEVSPAKADRCGPDVNRNVVLQLLARGRFRINHDDVTGEDLPGRLTEIYRTRHFRHLYFAADTGLPFNEIAPPIDIAQASVDHISIVTPAPLAEVDLREGTCLTSGLREIRIDRCRM